MVLQTKKWMTALCLAAGITATWASPDNVEDFTFIHLSDTNIGPHLEQPASLNGLRSFQAVQTLSNLGPVSLDAFGIRSDRPDFCLLTGDLSEFGFPGATASVIDQYFQGLGVPLYLVAGDHDNTWVADTNLFRRRHGGLNYTFEHRGVRFIILNSATLQETLPSFSRESITFLERTLAATPKETPLIIATHHPILSTEFASRFSQDRLLDVLRPYNVLCILDGHGHVARVDDAYGIPAVMGGSTAPEAPGAPAGYNIVTIRDGKLHVAYRRLDDPAGAKVALLEMQIPPVSQNPEIRIRSPRENVTVADSLRISARIEGAVVGQVKSAIWEIDDTINGRLFLNADGTATGVVPVANLMNGAHYIRLSFIDNRNKVHSRTNSFYVENSACVGTTTTRWRRTLAGSMKARPATNGKGSIFVGDMAGHFYSIDPKDGSDHWKFDAGAEILTAPALLDDRLVFFGAGDGSFHALNQTTGQRVWTWQGDKAVYGSPLLDPVSRSIYFGTNGGEMVALNAETGQELWRNRDARFTIESRPALANGQLLFTAWDGYVYGADAKTGRTLWRSLSAKSLNQEVRYLAPADHTPVVLGDRFFLTDRGYAAGAWNLRGQFQGTVSTDAAALAPASDGQHLYVRGQKSPLVKMDLNGRPVWTNDIVAGRLPVPPVEVDGKLFVITDKGTLYGINSYTGKSVWRYQVTPQMYAFAEPLVTNDLVFVASLDGTLTAVDIFPRPSDRALRPGDPGHQLAMEFAARSGRLWKERR